MLSAVPQQAIKPPGLQVQNRKGWWRPTHARYYASHRIMHHSVISRRQRTFQKRLWTAKLQGRAPLSPRHRFGQFGNLNNTLALTIIIIYFNVIQISKPKVSKPNKNHNFWHWMLLEDLISRTAHLFYRSGLIEKLMGANLCLQNASVWRNWHFLPEAS